MKHISPLSLGRLMAATAALRSALWLVVATVAIGIAAGCTQKAPEPEAAEATSVDTVGMLVSQVKRCSRLYTAEYQLRKVVSSDDTLALRGSLLGHKVNVALPAGQRKVAMPVEAVVKAGIDLSTFSEKNVERHGDQITILLPDPEVTITSTRIDHDGMRQYVSPLRSRYTDAELQALAASGRKAIAADVGRLRIVEQARLSAARQLVPFLVGLGYDEKNVTVTFRKDLKQNDIMRWLN